MFWVGCKPPLLWGFVSPDYCKCPAISGHICSCTTSANARLFYLGNLLGLLCRCPVSSAGELSYWQHYIGHRVVMLPLSALYKCNNVLRSHIQAIRMIGRMFCIFEGIKSRTSSSKTPILSRTSTTSSSRSQASQARVHGRAHSRRCSKHRRRCHLCSSKLLACPCFRHDMGGLLRTRLSDVTFWVLAVWNCAM